MQIRFTLTQLTGAIALISIASAASAAGLDRSGQPSNMFTDSGTTAYINAYRISPDTSGEYIDSASNSTVTRKYDEVAQDYNGYGFGAKTDLNDKISVGVFYDEPFGAKIEVKGDNPLSNSTNPNDIKNSQADVKSDTFTGLINIKLGESDNFQVYGGPVLSKIKGSVDLYSGETSGSLGSLAAINNYGLSFPKSIDYGYMVGGAFVKPEIGLKAAVTYRSSIEHDVTFNESMPSVAPYGLSTSQNDEGSLELPESVNIDFQTGLNKTTLLTAKARWVPWGGFEISPALLNNNIKTLKKAQGTPIKSAPLVTYSDDAYKLEVGIGKRLSSALAVSGSIGWDSGAGNPVTVLGPAEGYYSVGLGAKLNVTPEWAVSLGGKYLMLGDTDTQLSSTKAFTGKFEDNNAYVVGMKLSYAAK